MVMAATLVAIGLVTVELSVAPAFALDPVSSISLAVDTAVVPAGQAAVLTATTDIDVQGTASTITITDATTSTTLGTCTTGHECQVVSTYIYTGGPHSFVATVDALSSNVVTVTRQAWTLSLASDGADFGAGGSRTLTATANQSVSNTASSYRIYIFDNTTGSRIASCASGITCSTTTPTFFTGGPHEYVAVVAASGTPASFAAATDVQVQSNSTSVSRRAWTLALTTNRTELSAGNSALLTATANQDLGNTASSYRTYIFDTTAGVQVASCSTGTTCSVTQTINSGGPHQYVAVVAAAGSPATVATAGDVQVESNPVTLTRAPWTLTLSTTASTFAANNVPTLTATANQSVGDTSGSYRIYIFDTTTGQRVDNGCSIGPTCVGPGWFEHGDPHAFVAVGQRQVAPLRSATPSTCRPHRTMSPRRGCHGPSRCRWTSSSHRG